MSSSHVKRGRHAFIGARLGLLSLEAFHLVTNISRIKTYYSSRYAGRIVFPLNTVAALLVTHYLLFSCVYDSCVKRHSLSYFESPETRKNSWQLLNNLCNKNVALSSTPAGGSSTCKLKGSLLSLHGVYPPRDPFHRPLGCLTRF